MAEIGNPGARAGATGAGNAFHATAAGNAILAQRGAERHPGGHDRAGHTADRHASNRLPVLQGQFADLHRAVMHHTATAAEKALAAGAALVEAKALCRHGEWSDWLKATGVPERSARRYMLLHRAGFKTATVADLGMAEAERCAALGLDLMPRNGAGVMATGRNADGVSGMAVTWPEDDGLVRYWAAYMFPDPELDFCVTRACGLPFILGLLHDGFGSQFDTYTIRRMTPTETADIRARLRPTPN
jgi:hypothetical protein